MLVAELIQRVLSLANGGVHNIEERIKPQHIYSKALSARNKLIERRVRRNATLGPSLFQSINCVELIQVPKSKCPCAIPNNCVALRSKHKLPVSVNGTSRVRIVSTVEGSTIFNETTIQRLMYATGNKYAKMDDSYFIQDGYYYIVTKKTSLRVISVYDIFKKPSDVYEFPSKCFEDEDDCEDCGCESMYEQDFPIESELEDTLIELITNELIVFMNGGSKKINNEVQHEAFDDGEERPALEGRNDRE